jgi:GAF domain-containing protein
VQLFEKPAGEFDDVDRATLVHLAQMAAAAVERAQLYDRQRR